MLTSSKHVSSSGLHKAQASSSWTDIGQSGRPNRRHTDNQDPRLIYIPTATGTYRHRGQFRSAGSERPLWIELSYGPGGDFSRPAGSIITREQGKRFIAVKFGVREDRDLASAVE